jgi:hypothetical protein
MNDYKALLVNLTTLSQLLKLCSTEWENKDAGRYFKAPLSKGGPKKPKKMSGQDIWSLGIESNQDLPKTH